MHAHLTPFEECFWTLPFLKELKRNFEKSVCEFLCNASSAFADLWMDEGAQNEIKKMAQDFLDSNVLIPNVIREAYSDLEVRERMLFNSSPVYGFREIRLKFLDYEIKRLTGIMQKEVA
jgi:hypothetical protein